MSKFLWITRWDFFHSRKHFNAYFKHQRL